MQIINENYKKFPIKFYKTEKGVYFENAFIRGEAKDLTDAFNQLKDKLDDYELFYYYDDISDSKVGAFVPALRDTKTKRGIYLGKLEVSLDIDKKWSDGEQTVTYLSKHPEKISDHEKWIKKMKNEKKREEFFQKLKDGIKKIANYFQHEYFDPYKTREDLICEYCGEIIPQGSYYEEWHKKNYHLECIWDMFCNGLKHNDHEKATEYFLGLNEVEWDYSKQCKDDYDSDLELYKSNKRRGLCEHAAMYFDKKSNSVKDFVEKVHANPKECRNAKFQIPEHNLILPAFTLLHDKKHEEMTSDMWQKVSENIDNIFIAGKASKGTLYGKEVYHFGIEADNRFFALTVTITNDNYINTCFSTTKRGVEAYVLEKGKKNHSIGLTSQPSAPSTDTSKLVSGSSVATYGSDSNNIIAYLKEKFKCY